MSAVKRAINDYAAVRWGVLLMVSVLMFATYWFSDFMSPLQDLMRSSWGLSNADFGMVVGSYTWLNMAGAIILGGIILDRSGPRLCIFLFGGLAVLGAFLTWLGADGLFGETAMARRNAMIAGRVIFGVGLEVTCVLITKAIAKWFRGYELAMAMGINVAFGRLGTLFAIWFSADIAGPVSATPAIQFAAILVAIGVIVYIAQLLLEDKLDRERSQAALATASGDEEDEVFRLKDFLALIRNPSFIAITLLCVTFYSAVFPFIQYAPDLLVNKFGFSRSLPDLSDASWLDTLLAWLRDGPKVTGLIPLGTLFFTPLFGALVDKKGKAASLMMIGSALLIFAHLTFSLGDSAALGYVAMFALGVAFALVPAAMWPAVAKIVPESRLGTAYATMFTFQSWGLAGFFWGIGKVLDVMNPGITTLKAAAAAIQDKLVGLPAELTSLAEQLSFGISQGLITVEQADTVRTAAATPYDYTMPILMLAGLGVISVGLALVLKRADARQGYGLELPSGERRE